MKPIGRGFLTKGHTDHAGAGLHGCFTAELSHRSTYARQDTLSGIHNSSGS
jgi:hypothetical protein